MKSLLNKIESIPGTFSLKDKLSSSLISDVYECTYNQTKAVIRFDLPIASELAIDRKNEAIVLNSIINYEDVITRHQPSVMEGDNVNSVVTPSP